MTSTATKRAGRAGTIGAWALAFGLLAPWSPASRASADGEPTPLYHRDRSFRIPFELGGRDVRSIKELQLWMSEDAGFNWKPVSSTSADQKVFHFRARSDGEFWFSVRQVLTNGQVLPTKDETVRPGLKVIVDTQPPSLVVEAAGRQGSVAKVRWEAKDENLDLSTLALEYQEVGARDWKRVPLRQAAALGTASWDANTVESIRVKASVVDRAGNAFEATAMLPEGATVPPSMSSVDPEAGAAPPVEPFRHSRSPIVADPSFTPVEEDETPAPQSAKGPGWGNGPGKRTIARQTKAGSDALVNSAPAPNWDAAKGATPAAAPAAAEPAAPAPSPGDSAGASRPAGMFDDPFPNTGGGGPAAPAAGPTSPPEGEPSARRVIVNDSRFRLKYDIDDPGPGGKPHRVELWVTNDGGNTWHWSKEDPDRTSPIEVDLGGEGTFGITLVATSSSGQGDPPPAPRDRPQTWVEVDMTPPRVQLYPVQIGTRDHSGKVAISWRADDPHLADHPIAVYWRPEKSNEPWNPIKEAVDLKATDQFVWSVPVNFPARFHVRVEAVDAAGNRGFAETGASDPVVVDRSRPKSRIIGLDSDGRDPAVNR